MDSTHKLVMIGGFALCMQCGCQQRAFCKWSGLTQACTGHCNAEEDRFKRYSRDKLQQGEPRRKSEKWPDGQAHLGAHRKVWKL